MRGNKKYICTFSIITAIFLLVVIRLSIEQIKAPTNAGIVVINNITICILTGCIVALIQSIVGYANAKHDALLTFYKDALALDNEIIYYASTTFGFSRADEVIERVHHIITFFDFELKTSYMDLFFAESKWDNEINAAKEIFRSFQSEVDIYRKFEAQLSDDIAFMKASEEELCQQNIDIQQKNIELNNKTREAANRIVSAYNNNSTLAVRKHSFKIIEAYLFSKKDK